MKDTKEISKAATTDLELVEAIKSTDKTTSRIAFNKLYKKYHDSMLYHFKRMVNNDEETAEEIVLEAFLKVSLNIDKFNKETAVFSTWLFKLTQNLFIDNLRKRKENVIQLSDMATIDEGSAIIEYEIMSGDGTPEMKMITNERDKQIKKIIDSMENQDLAEFVRLRFFEGMSYEEIAKKTDNKLGTVKASLYRAKSILREEFEKANISM